MTAPKLAISDVSVEFGGVKAVNDVSIDSAGDALAIVGANGAGKTTLLNAVSGFVPMRHGRVAFDGAALDRGAARRAVSGVGRSFQHPHLMEDLTLEENVRGSRRGLATGEVRDAMAEFGLTDWMHRQIHELPYGIRKIADLLRAVLVGRRLLLCDEPFSGLDEHGRDAMTVCLLAIKARGCLLVVVEHDLDRVMTVVDQFVVLNFGTKIFDGDPGDAMRDAAVREALTGLVVSEERA
ncbi:MAG TPA: ATP-binding cassette domain-containing protein [Pseudonocardiaceae bacterium]|jgi:ABC-type branched-subunit amino acid transport system ATPase component